MRRSQSNGVKILVTVVVAVMFGLNAASNGIGWPVQTWLCIGGWAFLGVIALLSPRRTN